MNEIKIVIEGITELTEAVKKLLAALTDTANAEPVHTMAQPAMSAPLSQSVGQVPVQVPMQMPQPTYQQSEVPVAPVQVPVQPMVPTTAAVQTYTIEQLQVAAAGLSGMGKMPQVMGILQQFGIQAMTELPKERYGEFAVALREAGAQI